MSAQDTGCITLLPEAKWSCCSVEATNGCGYYPRLRILAGLAREDLAMKDRSHDEAMGELFQEDPTYALELLNSVLEDGEPGELLIALRQMTKAFGGMQSVAEKANLAKPIQCHSVVAGE